MLQKVTVQSELKRLNDEAEVSAVLSKAESITRFRDLSKKAEKSKSYTPAINAWKEASVISGVYERDGDDHASYSTFINNLTVNMGSQPQDIVEEAQDTGDIEAEWENIE
jgi:hypothetical protein